jgi:2-polyprenyl-3-methyl-5-hydroxy-6-metoxy-1,4-benzoquinol methylase
MTAATLDQERMGAFAGRLFGAATAAIELTTVYLGDRLGLYAALAEAGALSSAELAAATGTHERYVREWLQAQAVCGIVERDGDGRYALPPEHAEALLNRESPAYLAPVARMGPGIVGVTRDLIEAFRHGGGVPYERYGSEVREAQQDLTRPVYLHLLGSWIEALPDVHARLLADPPARAVDMGCGAGIAAVELARRYPRARVDGVDLDEGSIDLARANARVAGLDGRVRFHLRHAADPGLDGPYDLITMFDSLHHVAQPLDALRAFRALLAPDGTLLVAENRAEGDFERFEHLVSVVVCLPMAMAEQPSAGLGAVVPAEAILALAGDAGFTRADVAPIAHDKLRFYVLKP